MAEAIPFGIATEIVAQLGSSLFQEIGSLYGVEKELRKLENTLSTIKAALLDAEERQQKSHLVQDWIRKLKDAVFDADDLLDAVATRVSHLQMETDGWGIEKVRKFFFSPNLLAFRYKMGHKIKGIRERLDGIAEDMAKFNFREKVVNLQIENRERGQTHSFVLTSEVIGRDKNKEEIIELLKSSSSQENYSIIPIVGIGGLGKTTLAQFVYNDERVVKNFEKRMWICVTEDFDVEMIVRKMLASLTNCELGDLDMDLLQTRLRENLNDKMYLLVLDDMWNENLERWIHLKTLLVGGAEGSKILVTTRSRKVASVMGIESSYLLKGLTEEESWTLFKQVAFRGRQDRVDANLEAIGKRMVKRCKGVPLAIKTLGSVMQFKTAGTDWFAVENSEIWKLSQDSNDILPVLKLSYNHLPINLRQCFAYCSIFPKGYSICKDQLILLWIAQGYITPSSGYQNLEEIGDRYFSDLLLRSFFQDIEKDEYDNIITCKMHDLIHELAQTVAGSDCSILGIDAENVSTRVRHLSFEQSLHYAWEVPRPLQQVKGLRTFLLPVNDRWINESSQATLISNLTKLRVLDMHCLGIEKLPCSIGKLKHLRYLDISNNNLIERLPGSICNLLNLQTLLLSRCERLVELPRDLRKLINLRHLVIIKCSRLTCMPPGLGELTSLRTLTRFIVPRGEGARSDAAKLNELNGLNLLRGEIWLKNLECLSDVLSESKEANLKEKMYLQFLGLQWTPTEVDVSKNNESLLEILQPHANLKHLRVEGYGGIKFSSWLSSLRNVVRITIHNCPKCQYLPPLEHLPSLKFLHLRKLTALEYIEYSSNEICSSSESATVFFPSLQELWLYNLPNFKGWQRGELISGNNGTAALTAGQELYIQHLYPCLHQLTIQRCSKLTSMPFFSRMESLHLINSNVMVIAASPFFSFPSSLSPFSTIESLFLDKVEDFECLQEEALQKLTSLRTLRLKNCPTLKFLSPGINCLTELTTLEINECSILDLSNDKGIQWQGFWNLRHLIIDYLPRLFSMPEGLQSATTLQELRISNCYNLVALPQWIGNFSSLQELKISDCSSLTSLPEGIPGFASLQKMNIVNSSNFLNLCKRNPGNSS